jgi:hypothetical protein
VPQKNLPRILLLVKWTERAGAKKFWNFAEMRARPQSLGSRVKPTAAPPNNGGSDQSEAVPSAALTALWRGARLGDNKSNVRRAVLARMQSLGAIHETPKQFP